MRSSVELVSCRNVVFGEGVFCPGTREGRAGWWTWRYLCIGAGEWRSGEASGCTLHVLIGIVMQQGPRIEEVYLVDRGNVISVVLFHALQEFAVVCWVIAVGVWQLQGCSEGYP
jgi:hypothetical protein